MLTSLAASLPCCHDKDLWLVLPHSNGRELNLLAQILRNKKAFGTSSSCYAGGQELQAFYETCSLLGLRITGISQVL